MRYDEILTEGRDSPLYHGTGWNAALQIITSNEILPNSSHKPKKLLMHGDELVQGISLTRNLNTAFDFGKIVFEIDQRKLSQTNKLVPLDYWSTQYNPSLRSRSHQQGDKYEYEEFCVGAIKPFDKHLIAIWIQEKTKDRFSKMFTDEDTIKRYSVIFDNPLLKIAKNK